MEHLKQAVQENTRIQKHAADQPAAEERNGIQCCGSGIFIPDPGPECFHPGSLVKKILSSRKYAALFVGLDFYGGQTPEA